MDYEEEQNGEVEALASIYDEDLEILNTAPHKFQIVIKSEEYEDEKSENGLACRLVFAYTPKYPDEVPEIQVEDAVNLDDSGTKELKDYILEQANENLGMVMIFTLVSAVTEWLNVKWDQVKKDREELLVRRQKQEEELEKKKFEGTRVTVETFLEWKTKFEEEMKKVIKDKRNDNKLTGRELFMQDKTLNESDLRYFETINEKPVGAIDETLFQDYGEQDFDDEDDDDPDYVPDE